VNAKERSRGDEQKKERERAEKEEQKKVAVGHTAFQDGDASASLC
jgi:hypothetical protein